MRCLLVSPRLAVQKGDFLGSGVPYWPVELAVLAAFLRGRGDEVSVLDLFGEAPWKLEDRGDHYLQGLPLRDAVRRGRLTECDLVVLYAISAMSQGELLGLSRELRSLRPGAKLLVLENSQAVTAFALDSKREAFFEAGADALLCGEPYWGWDEVAAHLAAPDRAPAPENLLVRSAAGPVRRRFNSEGAYPVPAWELFPLKNYWRLPYSHGPKTPRYLPLLTSRGCPYPCDFCVVPETNGRRWRGRSPEEVVDEMLALRDRLGVRDFQLEDLNPTVGGPRWEAICALLIERGAGIRYSIVSGTKAETLKVEQVPLLARSGCSYLSISPESGSPSVLKEIGKPFDHEHALRLVEACRREGIYTQACILVGHPAETAADHAASRDYLRRLVRRGLDEAAVFIVSPLPGSRLHREGRIPLKDGSRLASFSPEGREGYAALAERRRELIGVFFMEKLKRGAALWLQGLRALAGRPRTKMENVPWRLAYLGLAALRCRLGRGPAEVSA